MELPICWQEGEPTTEGWYFIRLDWTGVIGLELFYCRMDPKRRGRMEYLDHVGGREAAQLKQTVGYVTHHCEPTPENFAMVFKEAKAQMPAGAR